MSLIFSVTGPDLAEALRKLVLDRAEARRSAAAEDAPGEPAKPKEARDDRSRQ